MSSVQNTWIVYEGKRKRRPNPNSNLDKKKGGKNKKQIIIDRTPVSLVQDIKSKIMG